MSENKNNHGHLFRSLPYLLFFTGLVLFFGFFADYIFFYQEKLSLFIFSSDFLKEHFNQPGSPLIYLGKFLTAFYFHHFWGAVILITLICLVTFVLLKIVRSISGREDSIIPLMFGIVIFYFHTSYQFQLVNSLGILLQLVFFYLTIRYLREWIAVIIFPTWYFLTGGFAWIYTGMLTLYIAVKSLRTGWPVIISLWGLILFFIWVLKEFVLFRDLRSLLMYPFSVDTLGLQYKLFTPAVLLFALVPLFIKAESWLLSQITMKRSVLNSLLIFVIFGITGIMALLRYDKAYREYFHVEKLFYQNRMTELVDYSKKHPSTNKLTIFLVNVALCESGKLNDQLFHFLQAPDGGTLFLKWEMFGEVLRRGAYFYYATGIINEAHRWAFENMVMAGYTPEGMKMLIKTEIINGNYKMASKYISLLEKTLFYRKDAAIHRKLLFDDAAVNAHPELGAKRKEKIVNDFFSITDNPLVNIEKALKKDSLNRKAFEYKMAWYMLNEDYEKIGSELPRLETMGYKRIPVHIGEAAMVYKISNLGPLPELGSLRIDPNIETRFNQFLQTFQNYGNNLKTAQPFLKQKYGNTFWYYAFYH